MRVNTEELAGQADELRHLTARTSDIRDTILHITAVLSGESVTAEFRPILSRVCAKVEECGEDLRRLSDALYQISDAYAQTEHRVTEETEYAQNRRWWLEPGVILLPAMHVLYDNRGPMDAVDWTPWDPEPAT